ncbi:MAG: SBBP repeat-containing protein, partial [Candidatus Binatia bacterium]
EAGNLLITLALAAPPELPELPPLDPLTLIEHAPLAWQEIEGTQVPVEIAYTVAPDSSIGFTLGAYDPSQPLTLDPLLTYIPPSNDYRTYLGGSSSDYGRAIAVDSSGNAYVTGQTGSADFPRLNPYQNVYGGNTDVFMTKLNATGNALVYSTYLGGSATDKGYALTVSSLGVAFLTGATGSSDFPLKNPMQGQASYRGGRGYLGCLRDAIQLSRRLSQQQLSGWQRRGYRRGYRPDGYSSRRDWHALPDGLHGVDQFPAHERLRW